MTRKRRIARDDLALIMIRIIPMDVLLSNFELRNRLDGLLRLAQVHFICLSVQINWISWFRPRLSSRNEISIRWLSHSSSSRALKPGVVWLTQPLTLTIPLATQAG